VEQNSVVALEYADRAYVLENGRVTLSGPSQELANDVYFSTHTYREDNRPEVTALVSAYEKEYRKRRKRDRHIMK